MANFKLDIKKLREETKNFETKYEKFIELYSNYNLVTSKLDSVWNDNNTPVFIEFENQQLKQMKKFHEVNFGYTEEINGFATNLESILKNNGVNKENFSLNYDYNKCRSAIRYLQSVVNRLERIDDYLRNNNAPRSSDVYDSVNELKTTFPTLKNKVQALLDSYKEIVNGIEKEVTNCKTKFQNIENVSITPNNLKYSSTVCLPQSDFSAIFSFKPSKPDVVVCQSENNLDTSNFSYEKEQVINGFVNKSENESLSSLEMVDNNLNLSFNEVGFDKELESFGRDNEEAHKGPIDYINGVVARNLVSDIQVPDDPTIVYNEKENVRSLSSTEMVEELKFDDSQVNTYIVDEDLDSLESAPSGPNIVYNDVNVSPSLDSIDGIDNSLNVQFSDNSTTPVYNVSSIDGVRGTPNMEVNRQSDIPVLRQQQNVNSVSIDLLKSDVDVSFQSMDKPQEHEVDFQEKEIQAELSSMNKPQEHEVNFQEKEIQTELSSMNRPQEHEVDFQEKEIQTELSSMNRPQKHEVDFDNIYYS